MLKKGHFLVGALNTLMKSDLEKQEEEALPYCFRFWYQCKLSKGAWDEERGRGQMARKQFAYNTQLDLLIVRHILRGLSYRRIMK